MQYHRDDQEIENIRNAHDLRDIIRTTEKRINRPDGSVMDRCIFHNDKIPSMLISQTRWWCFSCSFGGDVIDLYQRLYRMSWRATISALGGNPDTFYFNREKRHQRKSEYQWSSDEGSRGRLKHANNTG